MQLTEEYMLAIEVIDAIIELELAEASDIICHARKLSLSSDQAELALTLTLIDEASDIIDDM